MRRITLSAVKYALLPPFKAAALYSSGIVPRERTVISLTNVCEIFNFLKGLAPLEMAESYDNPGLLAGDDAQPVTKALIALDITGAVCEEAACKGAQLVISHHPVIFTPVRSVLKNGATAALWQLVSRGLSAVCMHTNLDIAPGGVNDTLARALGLENTGILKVTGGGDFKKLVVFVPAAAAESVRTAMAQAGAGRFGNYDGCAFMSPGTGYFRPLEGAKPFIGEVGRTSAVDEVRLEAVCRAEDVEAALEAMRRAHPYEEPAYDIFDDGAPSEPCGIGLLADLKQETSLDDFARFVSGRLSARGVRLCRAGGVVRRVALCSGAWDDELTLIAKKSGADTILTGEIKHSAMLLALELGLNVVAAGHFATENVICGRLAEILGGAFRDVAFEVAQSNTDPSYFLADTAQEATEHGA
jgi:dinuclear metal center YbgI/SA1388 family protein